MKTIELTGPALDWAVAKCEKLPVVYHDDGITRCIMKSNGRNGYAGRCQPSTDWKQGGAIIESERLMVSPEVGNTGSGNSWYAVSMNGFDAYGPTPLIAAMRCFVASKLGDEVDTPKGLT